MSTPASFVPDKPVIPDAPASFVPDEPTPLSFVADRPGPAKLPVLPDPSLGDRALGVLGATGQRVKDFASDYAAASPGISTGLPVQPWKPPVAPGAPARLATSMDQPIVPLSEMTPDHGGVRGVARFSESLTTPTNIGLIGGTTALNAVFPPAALPTAGYFSYEMGKGALASGKEALNLPPGPERNEAATMGVLQGVGAIAPFVGIGRSEIARRGEISQRSASAEANLARAADPSTPPLERAAAQIAAKSNLDAVKGMKPPVVVAAEPPKPESPLPPRANLVPEPSTDVVPVAPEVPPKPNLVQQQQQLQPSPLDATLPDAASLRASAEPTVVAPEPIVAPKSFVPESIATPDATVPLRPVDLERGSATSRAADMTGLGEFVDKEITRNLPDLARTLADGWDSVKKIAAPAARGSAAKETSLILREHAAGLAQESNRAQAALKTSRELLSADGPDANYAFIDRIERGEPQPDAPHQVIADNLRDLLDKRRAEIQSLGTGKLEAYYENYFPHLWKDSKRATEVAAQIMAKRPLAPSGFLKHRTLEYLGDGLRAGLEPVSSNAVDLALLSMRQQDRYIMAHRTLNEMKSNGLVTYVQGGGGRPPEGMAWIDDSVATVFGPRSTDVTVPSTGETLNVPVYGTRIMGKYAAPEPAARIINNYLSPGLQGNAIFNAYRGAGNWLNQFQLGMSAFHLGFTSLDAATSNMGLGLYQIAHGDVGQGLKSVVGSPIELAGIPIGLAAKALKRVGGVDLTNRLAPFSSFLRGDKMLSEWYKPGSQGAEIAQIVDALKSGGGRARMDTFYQTSMRQKMTDAWRESVGNSVPGAIMRAGIRAPLAAMEKMASLVLEDVVPRQKMGVFAQMMRYELERLGPDATHEQIRAAAAKIVDSVDNRLGQLTYDNLHWNKLVKDISMATVRSVGWNVGTWRELGGGVVDTAKYITRQAESAVKGGPSHAELTWRMTYLPSVFAMTIMVGGTLNYLMTGKSPESLIDYLFPQTGEMDEFGKPQRFSQPSYVKDLVHMSKEPVRTLTNKLHPMLGMIHDIVANRDYYGTQVVDPNDPWYRKGLEVAQYVGKQFEPLASRGARKELDTGAPSVSKVVMPFMGFPPAPKIIGQSPAQMAMNEKARERSSGITRTKEEAAHSKARADVMRLLRTGNREGAAKLYREKIASREMTGREWHDMTRRVGRPSIVNQFQSLTLPDAIEIFRKMSPQERASVAPFMRLKLASPAAGLLSPEDRAAANNTLK